MSAESISLITARAARMERGSGGISDISEADICHALALLHVKGAALLLRVKIAGQETFRPALIIELARRQRDNISELAYIAVDEYCAPTLCKTCNGRESHRVGDLLIVCQDCNGSGKHRHIAPYDRLGCSERRWKSLEGPYRDMLGRLSVWESIGIAAINSIQKDIES
jgi:hypothetical protein